MAYHEITAEATSAEKRFCGFCFPFHEIFMPKREGNGENYYYGPLKIAAGESERVIIVKLFLFS